jgi:hypothetical protein
MPKNRKRTTKKAAWATENLQKTVKSVWENGKSIHRVAKESVIPYSTLQKRPKKGLVSVPQMRRKPAQNFHWNF